MKHVFGNIVDSVVSVINPSGQAGSVIDTRQAGGVAIVASATVDANAAGVFAASSVAANAVTITAHGYKTGLVGQMTTAGSLPTGLAITTNYYIIVVDANTVKFATTYAHAVAGTTITISGGSGNSTFTPTSLATCSVIAQWSLDQVVWNNISTATSISQSSVFTYTADRPHWNYMRLLYAIASGSLTIANTYTVDKDA